MFTLSGARPSPFENDARATPGKLRIKKHIRFRSRCVSLNSRLFHLSSCSLILISN